MYQVCIEEKKKEAAWRAYPGQTNVGIGEKEGVAAPPLLFFFFSFSFLKRADHNPPTHPHHDNKS